MHNVLLLILTIFIPVYMSVSFPFQNATLPWDVRVTDLVNRLTLDEMVQQLTFGGGGLNKPCPAIPRLGIKPYNFDTECLRGVMTFPSTAFPQPVGLAATFNRDLLFAMAAVIGTEARAIYSNASAHGVYGNQMGISCLAPFINIVRHPLWGRVQEVYGEDPYLSGELAAGYIQGLQGSHPRYIRANGGCKVVDVHSGPEDIPQSRFDFNAVVSERDMRLTYLPNFKKCIEAGSYNLMCSYNSINGVPACANKWLLTDVLRKEFGFKGYFISDEGAIELILTAHHYVNSSVEAAAISLNAGVNLELTPNTSPFYLKLVEAVEKQLVAYDTIVERVRPLFYTRMRLGEFDPPSFPNPYTNITMSVVQSLPHRQLAVNVTTQTFVLLKNINSTLPLKNTFKKLAVVGPMANDLDALYGSYSPTPVPQFAQTPYQGLQGIASTTVVAPGCKNTLCPKYDRRVVSKAVSGADVIVVCLGTGILVETEGHDRSDLSLPGKQLQLLQDVVKNAKGPVIVLSFTGGPVDFSWANNEPGVSAILQCFLPGQGTGAALRKVLAVSPTGEVVSPSGKLPYTWPKSLEQVPKMTNYSMSGRTYRYSLEDPLYPFGYGLSYASFLYSDLQVLTPSVKAGHDVSLSVLVWNTGSYRAYETIQVYISWVNCTEAMPNLQLVALKKVLLTFEESVRTYFTITAEQMMIWNDKQGFIHHIGEIKVSVGGQQPNQKTRAPSNVLTGWFHIIP